MQISIAIPTYNRVELLLNSFKDVINDNRISEIVISDDNSNESVYQEIEKWLHPKIKLFKNNVNRDCYINKYLAVDRCSNDYVILLDSDNHIGKDYIDTIFKQVWNPNKILQPTFAKPHFDFRKFVGLLADKHNVAKYVSDRTFTTALNAANYFVNREEYKKVWDDHANPVTSDSIYQAYNWLNNGNSIYFVPGLQYYHRVEDHGKEEGSHYQKNNKRTPKGFHDSVIEKLNALK